MLLGSAAAAAALISSSLTSEALESWAAMLQSAGIWLAARYAWPGSFRSGSLARSASLYGPLRGVRSGQRRRDRRTCFGAWESRTGRPSAGAAAWRLGGPLAHWHGPPLPADRGAGCGGPDDPQDQLERTDQAH